MTFHERQARLKKAMAQEKPPKQTEDTGRPKTRYMGKDMYGRPCYHIGALPPPESTPPNQDDEVFEAERFDFEFTLGKILPGWTDEQYRTHWEIWKTAVAPTLAHARKSDDRNKEAEILLKRVESYRYNRTGISGRLLNEIHAYLNEREAK